MVERARHGDRTAFDALMRTHANLVNRVIGGMVRDPDDRQDLCQETFFRAFSALSQFEPGARFRPWIVTIALNAVRDHLRARRRRTFVSLDEPADDGQGLDLRDPAPSPDLVAAERLTQERVEGAFERLPGWARTILWLRVREELQYDEIAAVLGVPRGTVMSRLGRARVALRRELASGEGGGPSARALRPQVGETLRATSPDAAAAPGRGAQSAEDGATP